MKTLHISGMIVALCLIILAFQGCRQDNLQVSSTREQSFNLGWKFTLDSVQDLSAALVDDSRWQPVDLPHDWSISDLPGEDSTGQTGPFLISSPGSTSTGYVMGGTGWYRKHFIIHPADRNKTVLLYFDGAYMESDIWVNGKPAGKNAYGYTPFWFNISQFLNPAGEENVIAVRIRNEGRNSRWYSGSGIYRNVRLFLLESLHVPVWGVHISTPLVSDSLARVQLAITIENKGDEAADFRLMTRLSGPDGGSAGQSESSGNIGAGESKTIQQEMIIGDPLLWSPETPQLYEATVDIESTGIQTDHYRQIFGLRSIEFSAEKGFLLNGSPVELRGACMHHDNGLLGSAAFDRAEERRVEIMKANGYNAIRTSHNPPSQAFLDACDRLGMMVIDEAFDMWERPKNPMDYHRFFPEWHEKDMKAMLLRDRNHPSIIIWSIGNEINERGDSSGVEIAKRLISMVRQYDTIRPVTNAICEFWDIPGKPWEETAPAFELLGVGGYNYQWRRYLTDHVVYPERIMMGTESVPREAFENWQQVINNPWVIGDFVWTGMDYLGETGIGHARYMAAGEKDAFSMPWPWFNAWCGDIDICGNKKPQSFYRDVVWGRSQLEMAVNAPVPDGKKEVVSYWGWPDEYHGWNWGGHEGKTLRVSVYSTCTSVRLELNGKVLDEKEINPDSGITSTFNVVYEPGELKAVALDSGRVVTMKSLVTTGRPSALRLSPDRTAVKADRNDLSYIMIEAIDDHGNLVPDASIKVLLSVSGKGELIGSGNACPYDMESFGSSTIRTFQGRAMAILRPTGKTGSFTLKAAAEGMDEKTLKILVME